MTGQQNGKLYNETLIAWADIVLDIWRENMMRLSIRDTGTLWTSLLHHVTSQANGELARIDFFFSYYGLYVDMGAGGHPSSPGSARQSKLWYSKAFYAQVKRLAEILESKYGAEAARSLVGFISGSSNSKVISASESPVSFRLINVNNSFP
jgi:hypothetical protein